jgi:hypothetical protein
MDLNNTREIHEERIKELCVWIGRFGYLRNIDIAELMFYQYTSKQRMAEKITKAMCEKGLLLTDNPAPGFPRHFALSSKGARIATEQSGVNYKTGKDIIRGTSSHRDEANLYACKQIRNHATEIRTEREIATSLDKDLGGKVPDAIIIKKGGYRYYDWVEIENCRRSPKDLRKLSSWILNIAFADLSPHYYPTFRDGYLERVVVVIADKAANTIKERLIRDMKEMLEKSSAPAKALKWIQDTMPHRVVFVNQ